VQITELDVQTGTTGSKEERLARQADLYRDIARVAVEAPSCTAITTWGISDCDSWLGAFGGPEDGRPVALGPELRAQARPPGDEAGVRRGWPCSFPRPGGPVRWGFPGAWTRRNRRGLWQRLKSR